MTGGDFPFELLAERAALKEHASLKVALEKVEEAYDALEWTLGHQPPRSRVLRLARLLIHPDRRHKRKIVPVRIEEITLMGGNWKTLPIDSIAATCTECERTVEAYGTGSDSVRYACAELDDECGEGNWYERREAE